MKVLIKKTRENVSNYNRSTNGIEVIQVVTGNEQAYSLVSSLEDSDFFPQENGYVLSAAGNEVFDPNYPDCFDFVDYSYNVENISDLDHYSNSDLIRAVENAGIDY